MSRNRRRMSAPALCQPWQHVGHHIRAPTSTALVLASAGHWVPGACDCPVPPRQDVGRRVPCGHDSSVPASKTLRALGDRCMRRHWQDVGHWVPDTCPGGLLSHTEHIKRWGPAATCSARRHRFCDPFALFLLFVCTSHFEILKSISGDKNYSLSPVRLEALLEYV